MGIEKEDSQKEAKGGSKIWRKEGNKTRKKAKKDARKKF